MKALVTGGAGFIGSHLCHTLINHDYEVICVDNFLAGEKAKIQDLLNNPQFTLIEHDIIQPLEKATIEKISHLDFVYHLASPASPIKYHQYPIETLLVNSQGTYNLLELSLEKEAKFLYTSTSEIYGDPEQHPQKESYWGKVNPVGPRSCYDEGKRFGEALTMAYIRKRQVKAKIVRIFNTYGPCMSLEDGRVVSNFILQALRNEVLTINGDGQQTRSFCYIDDMIEGLLKMMDSPEHGPINLGNPEEISIQKLAGKIIQLTHSSSRIKFLPLPEDDPYRRQPDIALARQKLNWQPQISLEEGLQKTIKYFQKFI